MSELNPRYMCEEEVALMRAESREHLGNKFAATCDGCGKIFHENAIWQGLCPRCVERREFSCKT